MEVGENLLAFKVARFGMAGGQRTRSARVTVVEASVLWIGMVGEWHSLGIRRTHHAEEARHGYVKLYCTFSISIKLCSKYNGAQPKS